MPFPQEPSPSTIHVKLNVTSQTLNTLEFTKVNQSLISYFWATLKQSQQNKRSKNDHNSRLHATICFSGPFPCEICGRQFNDTGNRKRHIECTHGGKRKWTCFVCGKSVRERWTPKPLDFNRTKLPLLPLREANLSPDRTTLKEHLRIHSGEKPHLCSICGQSFRHSSSYRWVCRPCNRGFSLTAAKADNSPLAAQAPSPSSPRRQTLRVWQVRENLYTARSPDQASEDPLR